MHFAPEPALGAVLKAQASAMQPRTFCAATVIFSLDLSNMPEIANGSFDIVIAFDVLEHVPDYQRALEEVRRILAPGGWGIFTVPQKDDLPETFEDPAIVTPADRPGISVNGTICGCSETISRPSLRAWHLKSASSTNPASAPDRSEKAVLFLLSFPRARWRRITGRSTFPGSMMAPDNYGP